MQLYKLQFLPIKIPAMTSADKPPFPPADPLFPPTDPPFPPADPLCPPADRPFSPAVTTTK